MGDDSGMRSEQKKTGSDTDNTTEIFDDERDDARLRDGLAQTVTRYGWELLMFVFMSNHLHLFLRTPQPSSDCSA